MAPDPFMGDLQGFGHLRIVIGLVVGLSITRLLNGLARFVQNPDRHTIYPVHLVWVIFMLLFVTHFWWFQFGLSTIKEWKYPEYVFVLFYAALLFFNSSLLFPDQMNGYSGFQDYFTSRFRWFYGLLAAVFLVDVIDSAMKGREHFLALGPSYLLRQTVLAALAISSMFISDRRYHLGFGIFAIALQIWWIVTHSLSLNRLEWMP